MRKALEEREHQPTGVEDSGWTQSDSRVTVDTARRDTRANRGKPECQSARMPECPLSSGTRKL